MTESFVLTDARGLRQYIAHTLLPALPPATLGSIALLPHQRSAVARLRRILDRHHGALLADDVGLGKTFVALAVAHGYADTHVLAPAGLCEMWRNAIARAGPAHTKVHSLHAYSRTSASPLAGAERTLVVVDEAHYLRNARTARYRTIAQAVAGCDVLLLSATPLHNRTDDLQNLFALFRGDRRDSLAPAQLATLIVRRTTTESTRPVSERPTTSRDTSASRRPIVREHPPTPVPQDRDTLTYILALPSPLPAHDGAVAGALIRLGLLRAWCSSDAALAHALRTRRLRGAAVLDALRAGRHPSQRELRSWVVGDYEGQLAFPELLAAQTVESGPLLDILQRHLDALATLAHHHAQTGHADAVRAAALRQLLERHPDTPIVGFSQFTRTIAALQRALADIAGVGSVTSRTGRIASGPLPRAELLASFAPSAHGRPPPPPQQRIRLLLATDLIAEGVNLQDAGVVVHLDLPWTHALRTQRVGRCARLGSPHATVHVYRFAAAPFAEQALQLETRLARKHALTRAIVGTTGRRHTTQSAADRASAYFERLETWSADASGPPLEHDDLDERRQAVRDLGRESPGTPTRPMRIAALRHAEPAALLLLEGGPVARLVAVRSARARWRVHAGLGAVLGLMQCIDEAVGRQALIAAAEVCTPWRRARNGIRAALRRWWRREQAKAAAGAARTAVPDAQQTCTRTLQRLTGALPMAERHLLQEDLAAARRCIGAAVGAGYEPSLVRWSARAPAPEDVAAIRRWLSAWRQDGLLARMAERAAHGQPSPAGAGHLRESVRAVLLLVPD